MPDHIHMFVSLPSDISIASFVKNIKQAAGNYINQHRKLFPMFEGWAEGYCALTYSEAEKGAVINYIRNQKEHHKKISFTDEMKEILVSAGFDANNDYFRRNWCD